MTRQSASRVVALMLPLFLLASCGEYNKVLKSRDANVRYDYAKKAYRNGKYEQTINLLTDLITPLRGTPEGEDALYTLGLAHYNNHDYLNSAVYFKTYYQRYPKGKYTEQARFYSGYGYYLDSPDPQLDQSGTIKGLEELSSFLDYYPMSDKADMVKEAIFELQDKLTLKELQNAQLYYNMGNFLGNNYQAAIITAKNALRTYPYSKYREDFDLLILKSKFQEAKESVEEKKIDRFREVIDEYYSFVNSYPESHNLREAKNIYTIARKYVQD
ncbi:MAG: outer membrane protein assembly factor BamD [Muribaculaceae bacterium]|nr:outer membrane protein assembly factor BamD [Muribaculaceae bacterium]